MLTSVAALLAAVSAVGQPAAPPSADADTLLIAHFDDSLDADEAEGNATAEAEGAELVAEGKWGGGLKVSGDGFLSFDPEGNLDMSAGTLMLWIKPEWDATTEDSHALLSMGLDGDPPGYFALSQGWWETGGGARRMYFVYDNQAFMHTSTPVLMTMGEHLNEWQHITLTWAGGDPARAAIYLNGEHVASTFKTTDVTRQPRTRLFVGSDRAAEMAGERPSDCLFDELVIYGRVLTDSEIAAAYRGQESRWAEIQGRKWAWLTDTLAGPDPTFERDENGLVLESRALLDEGHPWSDPTNIPVIIDRMKRAGFNVYIPCVWHGRGTRYPGPTADPGLQDAYAALATDPLEELVTQCHAEGIEVHPWFCVGKRENDLHPEFVEDGTPKGFFDAHRPEFRDYIVKLMLEAIERYDVDGINLDYIRTGGICQGPKCQAEYKAKYGTELADDMKLRDDSGNTIDRVIEWQDEAISDIVARVAEGGRKLRPELIVSIDGHVHPPTSAPGTQGRNELPWIEAGWVDVVYNMDYGEHLGFETVNAVRAATGKPQAIVDLPGNYTRDDAGSVIPRDAQLVADHISYCQRRWPGNGVGLYLYSMLSDEQIDALRAGPFEEDAVPHWIR